MRVVALVVLVSAGAAGGPACGPIGARELERGGGAKAGGPMAELARAEAGRVVAVERAGRGSRLVLVDERGQRLRALTGAGDELALDVQPAWSPDGRWIVYASTRGRAGLDRFSLWAVSPLAGAGPPALLVAADAAGTSVDMSPTWMPDGEGLIFVSQRDGGSFDLWRVDVRAENGRLVAGAPARVLAQEGEEFEAAVAPDGKRVAFTTASPDGPRRLAVLELASGDRVELGDGESPAWTRDGKHVIFAAASARGDDRDIHRVPAGGGAREVLVDSALGDEHQPRVSSDGRWLVCTSVLRDRGGLPVASTLVFADLRAEPPRAYQALVERRPAARLGADLAPVPLRAEVLAQAPTLAAAIETVLRRASAAQDAEDEARE